MTPVTFEAAIQAPMHPALRWTPVFGMEAEAQHRRTAAGTYAHTVCGLPGPLTLAATTAPYCTDGCWEA